MPLSRHCHYQRQCRPACVTTGGPWLAGLHERLQDWLRPEPSLPNGVFTLSSGFGAPRNPLTGAL